NLITTEQAEAQIEIDETDTDSKSVPHSYAKAAKDFLKSALKGITSAPSNLLKTYKEYQSFSKEDFKSLELNPSVDEHTETYAHVENEKLHLESEDVLQKDAEAVKLNLPEDEQVEIQLDVSEACMDKVDTSQEDAEVQYNMGVMYRNGEGAPQDDAKAAECFLKAALQENANAQFNLGLMYHKGEGVPQNDAEAIKWYRKAARQQHVEAQFNLGLSYIFGEGVPQDYAEAIKWYRRAAEQGHVEAQYLLGSIYQDGILVAQDNDEAESWYRKAAEQGYEKALLKLNNIKFK
ncbi:MAG: hypothetical protein APR62_11920, partial [Smithella sp. SDB]